MKRTFLMALLVAIFSGIAAQAQAQNELDRLRALVPLLNGLTQDQAPQLGGRTNLVQPQAPRPQPPMAQTQPSHNLPPERRRTNLNHLYGNDPAYINRRSGPTALQQQHGPHGRFYDENGRLKPENQRNLDRALDRAYGPGSAATSRRIDERRRQEFDAARRQELGGPR